MPPDLDALNVRDFLETAVGRVPDRRFLAWGDAELSYRELDLRVNQRAQLWHQLGVRHGDRVAFLLENGPEFLFSWLGLAKLGGILVAVNTAFRAAEVAFVLGDSGARFALTGNEHLQVASEAVGSAGTVQAMLVADAGVMGHRSIRDADTLAGAVPPVELRGDDLISLVYTSGTTGRPKGVMQTHRNYVLTGQALPHWLGLHPGDCIYACLPLFHVNTQAYAVMGAIGMEGTLALAPRFSASRFWDDVRRHRANAFTFIGAMSMILAQREASPVDRDHDVRVAYGVPALPHELRVRLEDRYGMRIISGFGMSETTFGLIEPLEGERRAGSIGRPRQHPDPRVSRTEAKIVDATGREMPHGQVGELVLRGPALMAGYWGDLQRTREALRDGWLWTGDAAWRDADGYFFFADRIKELIRRRGENVSPLEVEVVLSAHPDVIESAVVGVPSALTDEDLLAVVVARPGRALDPEALLAWCAERLASFKVPRYVQLADSLPRTSTQKVEKQRLREAWTPSAAVYDRESAGPP